MMELHRLSALSLASALVAPGSSRCSFEGSSYRTPATAVAPFPKVLSSMSASLAPLSGGTHGGLLLLVVFVFDGLPLSDHGDGNGISSEWQLDPAQLDLFSTELAKPRQI